MKSRLLSDIEEFQAETGMGDFRFGLKAVRNGRLLERLRGGKRIWPETEAQIRGFMISHRRSPTAAKPASHSNQTAEAR